MDYLNQSLKDSGFEPVDTSQFVLPGGIITKDGDTFKIPGRSRPLRLQGVNTAETQKTGNTAEDFKAAEYGADTQHQIVRDAIVRFGFTRPTFTGLQDINDRDIGDLENDKGERLSDYLLTNRLADPLMPTQDQTTKMAWADLYKAKSKADFAPLTIADAMHQALNVERNQFPLMAKPYADTALQYGASLDKHGKSDYMGAGYIRPEENYKGEARSNLMTGLRSGTASMQQGAYNVLDMLGRSTGSEYLQNVGQSNSQALGSDLRNFPVLRNGEALDDQGNWKLDSFSKMADYVIGTAASSTPQMAMSILATMAAPATGGASLALPAAVYAGQTWENQKEKNVGWAILSGVTQSAIETLGVTGKFTSIFEKSTQKAITEQLIAKGMTRYEAEQAIIRHTQKAIQEVTEAAHAVEGGFLKQMGGAAKRGVLDEAPEEMLQELTQYYGEQAGFVNPDTPEGIAALKNRILNAGVGGAVLGPTFGVAHHALAYKSQAKPTDVTMDADFRDNQVGINGRVPTAQEIIDKANKSRGEEDQVLGLAEIKAAETFKRTSSGIVGSALNWVKDKGLSSLYGKWSSALAGDNGHSGEYSAALWTLLGANRAFNGGSIEEQQAEITKKLQNSFGSPVEVSKDFNMPMAKVSGVLADPKVQNTILKLIDTKEASGDSTTTNALNYFTDNGKISDMLGNFVEHKAAIAKYADRIQSLVDAYNDKTNSKLSVRDFIRLKPVNKNAIQNNQQEFAGLLSKHLGISGSEANQAVSKLLGDPTTTFISDPFDDIFNDSMNSHLVRDNLSKILNDPKHAGEFSKYLNMDMNENAYGLAAKGGSHYVNKNLIGENGSHLASLLQAAIDKGELTSERASFVAHELNDWLGMREGSFHEVKNKYAMGALNTINFLNMVVSLPLAAVSSTVEFAQIYRNLNLTQSAKATRALLEGTVSEIAGAMASIGGKTSERAETYHQKLYEAGYQSKGDIGKRNDVVVGYYQKWTEGFFKITGLTSVTNVTRYAKLAIGADAINNWLSVVEKSDINNPSQAAIDAKEHLIRIGVDVEGLLAIDRTSPENQMKVYDELTRGTHNFISEAVIHPTKMNRPKFYSDPYLQLFTQFQGYTSAFTANVLPRLLGDLRKNGSADQVNAAATIAMMMALTYMALSMKDIIKYGETPPAWLKEDKKFQRFIGQAGILGSGQRIWDTVSSVVPESTQKQSVLGQAYKQISDQAPALSYINKVNDALSADPGQKTKAAARLLPVFGTSPAFAKYIQKELGDY